MRVITAKNHKIEIESKGKIINSRIYYKDTHGMWNHALDMVLNLDESVEFVRKFRQVQEDVISKNGD